MNRSSLSALFKEAFRIYNKNTAKIIGLAAMICLPIQLLSWFTDYRLNNIDQLAEIAEQWNSGAITDESLYTALAQDGVGKFYIYLLVAGVITILGAVFSIAVIKMAMDDVRFESVGEDGMAQTVVYEQKNSDPVSVGDYFSFAVRKLPKYAWTVLVGAVFTLGGLFLCMFPGIIAMVISLFTVYAVVLTPFWGAKAFHYTASVLRFRPMMILFYIGIAFVQELIAYAALSIPRLFSFPIAAECIFSVVITCILQIGFALFDILMALIFADTIRNVPVLAELAAKAEKPDQNGL